MKLDKQRFEVRLAADENDIAAAQRLRYRVFVEEMGATADEADHDLRLEKDRFDAVFDHLILVDKSIEQPLDRVIGAYRLLPGSRAAKGSGFYGASEYDLSKIEAWPNETVELGRSCVDADYRGGVAMHLLWNALAEYVLSRDIEILFGVASFPGTDTAAIADALSYLHHKHLAPEDLRVRTREHEYVSMNLKSAEQVDGKVALRQIPNLIKAYLRLGGFVGDGAYIDRNFNTVDVCLLMDTKRMTAKYRDYYTSKSQAVT